MRGDKQQERRGLGAFFRRLFGFKDKREQKWTNVYFISGMCYNCKVFDRIELPSGFRKRYIEWNIPGPDETLHDYSVRMAEAIDTTEPFVLVGYSFGAIIIQEMDKFLSPTKNIIISSFKKPSEIPAIFKAVRKTGLARMMPDKVYSSVDFITNSFNRLVYRAPDDRLNKFMTHTDPVYIKWAVHQITEWIPDNDSPKFYHIHGTDDQIFPFKQIENVYPVEGGDHLMVVRKAAEVSSILAKILSMK